ncbi:MAG TPA: sensor histidine kinase KdpD [Candidatus Eisenbacteria bacterium]|nr:sensor histidine kinase KdpD [Candidatus Eisenbacteria bacterium]
MTEPARPTPEEFLARARAEEERLRRAKFKIFFGACAGVGKTYAMLVEAHERKRAGTDVVVGLVETHGRRETELLLDGLEAIPRADLPYRGTVVREFDLDAALARRPALLLLDELAHTNAPGSRHRKRWQDIEELLAAGIDVYTTLNVQHVESLLDVVRDITGIPIRESVPDSVLDRADEVELVDLPPDDLLQRLHEGKVYVAGEIESARANFFRKGNLIALRELALRQTAQRVDAQMETYRLTEGIRKPWSVRERILVCVGDPATGVRLVRAARRLAGALRADWIVVHVETPGQLLESRSDRDYIVGILDFAFELGAETSVLTGLRVSDELLAFASARNVSRIVLGESRGPRWLERVRGSLAQDLIRRGRADVWVIRGEEETERSARPPAPIPAPSWRGYGGALPIVALCTLAAAALSRHFDLSNLAMLYLVGVVVAATAFGRGPAILTSFLGVVAFDFFFVPPRYTFSVSDSQYLVTFSVMLLVAIVIGTLTARLREQLRAARQDQRRTAALNRMSQELVARGSLRDILGVAVDRIAEILEAGVAILLPDAGDRIAVHAGDGALFGGGEHERAVAQWTYQHGKEAGRGTGTLSGARALHVPLAGSTRVLGVLSVRLSGSAAHRDADLTRTIQILAGQTALAVERCVMAESAEKARSEAEAERARSALLGSVSHDLRTPLAAITGAATSLLEDQQGLPEESRRQLAESIVEEARRLNRLIADLLEMTRLESGALSVRKEWSSIEEIVGAALTGLESTFGDRPVRVEIPDDLPLVPLDEVLFEQVVRNLLENANKYGDPSLPIEVAASATGNEFRFSVADRGPGLAAGDETRVFEKFYRGAAGTGRPGAGLGLSICRGIVEAHQGRITASNRPGGGAEFVVWLPIEGRPPRVSSEPEGDEKGAGA